MQVGNWFDAPRGENEPDICGMLKVNDRKRVNELARKLGAKIIHKFDEHDFHTKGTLDADPLELTPNNIIYLRFEDDGSFTLVQMNYDASSLDHLGRLTWEARMERAKKEGWI